MQRILITVHGGSTPPTAPKINNRKGMINWIQSFWNQRWSCMAMRILFRPFLNFWKYQDKLLHQNFIAKPCLHKQKLRWFHIITDYRQKTLKIFLWVKTMAVKEVAELLGKSEQFIRIGLQRGILPFGCTVKMSSKWTYYVREAKLREYLGKDN